MVIDSPGTDLILGLPWLSYHNPVISWSDGELQSWGNRCFSRCIPATCGATHVESPDLSAPSEFPSEYKDLSTVFSKTQATHLPPHRPWDCAIDLLPGTTPPRGCVYPLSVVESEAMEEYIQEALELGFIRPSTSPAAASFFFIEKKGGGLRPCVDYRGLNDLTVKYRYPLPLVPAALEQVRGACYFTKLDLRSAYNMVRIRKGDEWKTAFITTSGHYEYLVMPYGLANAPSVFQALVNEVLRPFLNRFVIAYIDDILIYSPTWSDHVSHVRQVLARLLQHRLYVKAENCEFHQTEVRFLGYILDAKGSRMDQTKITAVTDWPRPQSIKDLQRFLGFANFYRRFIRNFSSVAAPLTSMLGGAARKLCWTDAATQDRKSVV